jgi:transposase
MMGRQRRDQGKLFYEFRLDDRIPKNHLLRRIDVFVTVALGDLHEELEPYYSDIGRPSVDPELMLRMLIVGYCCGIRSERRLTQEVELHLAYLWSCKLDLRRDPASLDLLGQPAGSLPRKRRVAPYLRARCLGGDGNGPRQG